MNVKGFSLDRRGGQFDTTCEVHKEVQADIMCGQELNLDSDHTYVCSILYSTSCQHWRRSRLIFGTTPIPFTNPYKPGGTIIMSAGDVTSRFKHQEKDKWGRWVSQTVQGRNGLNGHQYICLPSCRYCNWTWEYNCCLSTAIFINERTGSDS